MKNIGMKIAMVAIFVNAPRFVITFLAADAMRFPALVEGTLLAVTGVATGVVLTGGGAYIAHELIAMRGRFWSRIFMGVSWVLLLAFSVIILAPMMAAMLEKSELATVLNTVELRLWWSVASVVAIEVLTAGAMVAHAATQNDAVQVHVQKTHSAWSAVSDALAKRIAVQLQPVHDMQVHDVQYAITQPAQSDASYASDALAHANESDVKSAYLRLRASGKTHVDAMRVSGAKNASTARSWWERYRKANMQFATGD